VEPETALRQESERHASSEAADDDQDVFLDIPSLYVESLDLEVADLRARVSLQAEVLNLLRLNVGIDAVLGQVRLDLSHVEAQALLKVRLDKVAEILNRVLDTIDANPEIIEPLSRAGVAAVERAAKGVGQSQGEEPPSIEVSAIVEAAARQAEAEAETRQAGTERRPGEGAGRQRLPGEQRRYRGLPRRAKRR
jgi:hypothetical protein